MYFYRERGDSENKQDEIIVERHGLFYLPLAMQLTGVTR